MLVKLPRELKVSSLNYICWKIPGACSYFSFSATLWNHSLFYSDVLFFFSCIQPISHGWCILNTLTGFQRGCAPCVHKAEVWDNGISVFTFYTGKLYGVMLPYAQLWTDIWPHLKPKKEVVWRGEAKPLRPSPRRRRKKQSLLDGFKQSLEIGTAWIDAWPQLTTDKSLHFLCFCFPICEIWPPFLREGI